MTHDDIHADLPLFALDALDPPERIEIEAHLATGCPSCARELSIWSEAVGAVGLEGEAAPAPDLKPQLLQRVRNRQATLAPVRPRRRPAWIWAALPLAAILLLALAVSRDARLRQQIVAQQHDTANLSHDLDAARASLDRVTTELAAKEHDLGALHAALAAAQESLAILAAPGLQLVSLTHTPQALAGEAHVLINTDAQRAAFYAFDLPSVPSDKIYELWWITDQEGPVKAGVFRPDPRGFGRVDTAVPVHAGTIRTAAVTIEPAEGVPKPSGRIVLVGNLEKKS